MIYNKSFFSDLKDYKFVEDSSQLKLAYTDPQLNNVLSTATINTAAIKSIVDAFQPTTEDPNTLQDVWLPAIISNDDFVQTKETLLGNVIGSKILGIEEVIKFDNLKFKNWQIESGAPKLCIDWAINSSLSSYEVDYGVLFWYKLNRIHKSDREYSFDKIPIGTRIKPTTTINFSINNTPYTITNDTVIIKSTNDSIKVLDKDSSRFDSSLGRFVFNTSNQQHIVPISSIPNIRNVYFFIEDNTNKIDPLLKDYDFWIANGEFYSYFLGGKDRFDRQNHRSIKLPSRSYLSPSLYHIYRTIYNTLTATRIKTFNGLGQTYKLEKLKKLCYLLASSPLIDRVNINILQDNALFNLIDQYVSAPSDISINTEIQQLINIVHKIFIRYSQQTYTIQKQTLATNYINNKTDLFVALNNKYGSYIKIDTITKIKHTKALPNGSHGYLNIDYKSCFNKNISTNPKIFNDIKIDFGHMYAETMMDPAVSSSGCILKLGSNINNDPKNTTPIYVPLSNMQLPRLPEKLLTVFNKDIKVKIEQPNEINTFTDQVDITQSDLLNGLEDLSDNISYSWSLVNGSDSLRFSDYATQGNFRNYWRNSADPDPYLHIRQTGLYTIQGITSFGSTLKCIENINIYAHNNNNEYEPGKSVPSLLNYSHSQSDIDNIKKYRILCPNLRSIAFHKAGMVWIVDSDMFVCDVSNLGFDKDKRLVDMKFSLHQSNKDHVFDEDDTDKYLSIEYKPNNTVIKLFNVSIENMRSSSNMYSQCKAFYEPKVVRQPTRNINVVAGAARFNRANKYPYELDIKNHLKIGDDPSTSDGIWTRNSTISFSLPNVSNGYAPDISVYGGYSQSVVSGLGVEIPFHPVKINNQSVSQKQIPPGTFWNTSATSLTSPESGLLASNPALLNKMVKHNDMGGINPAIRCHLVNIPNTGYTIFNKGYFHPNSGWYSSANTQENPQGNAIYRNKSSTGNVNISSVKKFNVSKYDSYEFEGAGFYDLRPNHNHDSNVPITYSSAIELISYQNYITNFMTPWQDQDPNYGIRNLNGITALSNYGQETVDDFLIIRDQEFPADFIDNFVPTNKYILLSETMNNLSIEDLELSINYINIANIKNIVFALEIYNPNLDSVLSSNDSIYQDKVFLPISANTNRLSDPIGWIGANQNTNISTSLLKFISEHKKTNTLLNQPNTKIIYLYNQESLDNYGYNFSFNFSDNLSKVDTFTDENKIAISGVGFYNEPIKHSSTIHPCISPTGYSEQDDVFFRQIIKNNRLNLIEGSFSKIKKLPLKDTKFTLKVYVFGPEESVQPLDNTILNSYLSGLVRYDQTEKSNSIKNSICNWKLIIHTKKTPKFTNKDYLGSIEYGSGLISSTGYNYIADFTGKEYLIPKINLNAPYDYIANNVCKYPTNDELSKPLTYPRIEFPYVARYTPTFFTLVGAMTEMQILRDSFAIGGRGDPIINMLWDIRAQRQQQEQERFFFKPVYEGGYLGSANKALIQASKDGYNWYRMEVPIFKYNNTAILTPNKFKYLKLHKDMAVPFSNFAFTTVKQLEDLIDKNMVAFTTTRNISLNGLDVPVSQNETVTLKENDLVEVKQQTNASENGFYYATSGAPWINYFNPAAPNSLLYHKLWDNNTVTQENATNKKLISIIGSRAFNLFDVGDTVSLMTEPAATGDNELFNGFSIQNKALIKYQNIDLSIFTLNNAVPSAITNGFLGQQLSDSNLIMIYKDNTTYGDQSVAGKWSFVKSKLEKEHINTNIIDGHSVAVSEGAIGYGSNYLQPTMYSRIENGYPNTILNTTEILNNNINDKIKYNSISALQYSDNAIKDIYFTETDIVNDLLKAFPYRYTEAEYSLNALNNYNLSVSSSGLGFDQNNRFIFNSGIPLSGIDLNNLKNTLKNSLNANDEDYFFVDLKSNKFKNLLTSISGEIILENDFVRKIPIQPLSSADLSIINVRLSGLNTKSSPPPTTIDLSTISSIPDLETFYYNLPVDKSGCFQRGFYSAAGQLINCSGAVAKQKLLSLYTEKNNLLSLIENHNNSTSGVLPYASVTITQNPATQSITAKYEPKAYYFINIDAEQECSLSEDSTVKILNRAIYTCEPIVEFYQYPECDSVCKSASIMGGLDENVKDDNLGRLIYTNNKVDTDKQKYPGIQWSNQFLYTRRSFHILCEDSPKEVLVKVLEEYIVPQQTLPKKGLVKNIFNLDTNDSVFIKFRNMPRKVRMVLSPDNAGYDPADNTYVKHVYDVNGRLSPTVYKQSGGQIDNGLYMWQCIKVRADSSDPHQSQDYGEFVEPPDIFKWMNEMIFRGYFNSIDGVEHKNTDIMDTKEMWEWIPYEYFVRPTTNTPITPGNFYKYMPNGNAANAYCAEPNQSENYHNDNTPLSGPYSSREICEEA